MRNKPLKVGSKANQRNSILLLILMLSMFLSFSCQRLQWSSFNNTKVPDEFQNSNHEIKALIDSVNNQSSSLNRFSGSAKVLVSGRKQSERVSIEFSSSQDSTFIKVKGSLGMEGAHFWMVKDSLYLNDRIEGEKYRFGINDYDLPFPFVYLRYLRLSDLLSPDLKFKSEPSIWESQDLFLLANKNGEKNYIRKKDYTIRKQYFPELKSWPSLTVEYDGYNKMHGYLVPRKIQLSNKEESFRLFLLIQKFEPDSLSYGLTPFRKGS